MRRNLQSVVIATHNIMQGRALSPLTRHHLDLRERVGLDLLCIQENVVAREEHHARTIASSLGAHYEVVCDGENHRQAAVYDSRALKLVDHRQVRLPRLTDLRWFERLYIVDGKTEQRTAQVLTFRRGSGQPFTVVNLHLDAAGGHAHRRRQVIALAEDLKREYDTSRAVVCGDTNAFSFRNRTDALREVMRPLADLGLSDDSEAPTHYFARQREPMIVKRAGVALGRLGIDLPRRFDVVYSALGTSARGQTITEESDHDLVWAVVDT